MPTRHKYFMVATIPSKVTYNTWNRLVLWLNKNVYYVRKNRCYLINARYVCKDAINKIDSRIFKCYSLEVGKRKFWVNPHYRILIPKNWAHVQEDEKTYLKRLEKL